MNNSNLITVRHYHGYTNERGIPTGKTSKHKFVCTECGSDDVRVDSYSAWDSELSQFVHVSEHEEWVCENCGTDCYVEEASS